MKITIAPILILGIAIALASCSTTKNAGAGSNSVEKKWIHTFEEDEDQVRVYHSSDYEQKPSRGREQFTLLPDGVLEISPISPNDKPTVYNGLWKVEGKTLQLTFNKKTLNYEIIEVQANTLKLKLR